MYDGTYTGTFNYKYGPLGDISTPASMTVTITFDSRQASQTVGSEGISLVITNIIISEQSFGTGTKGVTPVRNASSVLLPAAPVALNLQKSNLPYVIRVSLPNDSNLIFAGNTWHTLLVSTDGKTLSGPDFYALTEGIFAGTGSDVYTIKEAWKLTKVSS